MEPASAPSIALLTDSVLMDGADHQQPTSHSMNGTHFTHPTLIGYSVKCGGLLMGVYPKGYTRDFLASLTKTLINTIENQNKTSFASSFIHNATVHKTGFILVLDRIFHVLRSLCVMPGNLKA